MSRRMTPFNHDYNKAQLQLMGKPMMGWTLQALAESKVEKVVIVINSAMQLTEEFLSVWRTVFAEVQVVVQAELNGQAGALVAALPTLDSTFLVVNANHVTANEFLPFLDRGTTEIGLLCIPTSKPELYGIVDFDHQTGVVSSIVEKPSTSPANPHRLIGMYRLTREFVEDIARRQLHDSSLEETLNDWAGQGRVAATIAESEPPTLKYAWHLLKCKEYLWSKLAYVIDPTAIIAPTAIIRGEVTIGAGAIIGDYAIVEGPAYIGARAVVGQHCVMRKGSVLEAGAQIQRHTDLANSILMTEVHVHSGFIGDSIIGERTTIGAGFVTANRRMDRNEIVAHVGEQKASTGLTSLGVMVGADCRIGIQVGTMPNVIIAAKSVIEPGRIVRKNVGV